MESVIFIFFCSVALVIVGCDIKEHRIPNGLVITGMLSAFIIRLLEYGIEGCVSAVVSMLIPLGLLFPVYMLGMIGAGDIKLLCMYAVLLNWEQVLYLLFYACALGSVWSLVRMIINNSLVRRFQYLKDYVVGMAGQKNIRKYFTPEQGYKDTIPFALPIGLSYVLHLGGMY